jgi:hypothetical protein
MKICAVGTELFHVERWTDGCDVARGLFSRFYESTQKSQ